VNATEFRVEAGGCPHMFGIAQTRFPLAGTLQPRTVRHGFLISISAKKEKCTMNLNLSIGPLVALIAGVLILFVPRMLNYIVAIYLIVIGLLGLFGGNFHFK
jgi:hypothetical protein